MNEFNEQDHIEMLEREVLHWKGSMQKASEELAQVLQRLTIFENATVENTEKIIKLKEDLNEANKIRGDLKLQLMDKNDKHSEEMKVMYDKMHEMENRWAQAVSTAAEERETRKSYERDLITIMKLRVATYNEMREMEVKLKNTTRQKRHILRAFNDKTKEVANLKKRVRQLECENPALSETVNVLSNKRMDENRILGRAWR